MLRRWWAGRRQRPPAEPVVTEPPPPPVEVVSAPPDPPPLWSIGNPCERPVDEAVAFALKSARLLIELLGNRDRLRGASFLEIGPGQDLGLPLIAIGLGAIATATDRYPVEWDPSFHPAYYQALLAAVRTEMPEADPIAIATVVERQAHSSDGLRVRRGGLEDLDDIADASIDISYSNATLEHIADVTRAIEGLARITRPGGVGFHQTDFRDHRTFDRPLEFLTCEEEEFQALLVELSWSCGNRVRPSEFLAAFDRAGFRARLEPNLTADADYVADVLLRCAPKFRQMSPDEVGILGGRFILERR